MNKNKFVICLQNNQGHSIIILEISNVTLCEAKGRIRRRDRQEDKEQSGIEEGEFVVISRDL